MAAIRLLQELQADNRHPSHEEQHVLLRYVGWGGLPQAFDAANQDWHKEYTELSNVLTGSEYDAARRSTQDAHYTPESVIRGMYAGLERLGFDGGRILEPASGTGHFIGLVPQSIEGQSQFTAIELDPTTAQIGKYLYPNATHINRGFQDVTVPSGIFDAVVGNPPFGNQPVFDARHRELKGFSIHNYFMSKSLDKVREGGLMAFVVSRYFMDAMNNPARRHIADRAHLLGAIRLPYNAFKQNALAEVTTDILFFQKTREGEQTDRSWLETNEIRDCETGKMLRVNQYFIDHPEQILGRLTLRNGMFGDAVDVVASPGTDIYEGIVKRLSILPENVYRAAARSAADATTLPETTLDISHVKVGAYFLTPEAKLARRLPDLLDRQEYELVTPRHKAAIDRIRQMIPIRDTVRSLLATEASADADEQGLQWQRSKLNQQYDRFVAKYGFLSAQPNKLAMQEDPDYPLLYALENNYDKGVTATMAAKLGIATRAPHADKAAIFSMRVLQPRREVTAVESAKDALVVSMNQRGKVDVPLMVRLTGKTQEELLSELQGRIYLNPVNRAWETADKYLSGNVKEKLEAATQAAYEDALYQSNVEALKQVQPAPIEPVDIAIQLGSTWVPAKYVVAFANQLLSTNRSTAVYFEALGKWSATFVSGDKTLNQVTWGTERYPATALIEAVITNKSIQVKDEAGTDISGKKLLVLNEQETAAAQQKADEIRQAFLDWVWEDAGRREELTSIYNARFNTNVPPKYDGSHLELPGGLLGIEWRTHQKNAVWRGIQEGTLLADHTVGAGKTFVNVAIAMESRRMGLLNKPMLIVPNHLLLEWKTAFYNLYPDANVLVAEKTDFTKENRERLFARVATGDWDAVIIAHSSFKKIGMPEETFRKILNEQINDLAAAINQMKAENGERVTIKELEKSYERMKTKLEEKGNTGSKDQVVSFAELGVDALMVDEAHEFKNLFINTSLSRVSGLGNLAGSEKAFDLFVKCRYLQQQHDGRGVFFSTGTPISNTIAELYTVQRYMQYDDLKARGLVHFDAWASTFGEVVSGWELDATGVNYRLNSRFAKFKNVPELIAMYRSFADVVTQTDLNEQAQALGKRFPVPKIKGGKPRNIIVERHDDLARYMGVQRTVLDENGIPLLRSDGLPIREWNTDSIIHRMENLPKDPRQDNPLKITNDARKAGLDYRLISPQAQDYENSKVNTAITEIFRIWQEWDERKGTQLIFCDLSTPKKKTTSSNVPEESLTEDEPAGELSVSMDDILAGSSAFSVYDDIRNKLIRKGVPEHHIRFIHDASTDVQKFKLFGEMNRGEARILLGSTAKMGAGTNVQQRLVALHHLDAPWRPSDLEQREGRIIRQGNLFYAADSDGFEIEINRYATKQTYDSRMWQTIEYKAAGIEQFRRGDMLTRVIEDVAGEAANAAEMKAAATGNPLILMQVQLQANLKKLESLRTNHQRNLHTLHERATLLEGADGRAQEHRRQYSLAISRRDANSPDEFILKTESHTYTQVDESLLNYVQKHMRAVAQDCTVRGMMQSLTRNIGEYRGFMVSVCAWKKDSGQAAVQFALQGDHRFVPDNLYYKPGSSFDVSGFFRRCDNFLNQFEANLEDVEQVRLREIAALAKVQEEIGKPFPKQQELEDLRQDVRDILTELRLMQADPNYVSLWQPRSRPAQKQETPQMTQPSVTLTA